MTEAEWLASHNPGVMATFLRKRQNQRARRGTARNRKHRLFACACCRSLWSWLSATDREVVDFAERYADGHGQHTDVWNRQKLVLNAAVLATLSLDSAVAVAMALNEHYFSSAQRAGDSHEAATEAFAQASSALASLLRDIVGNPFRPVTVDPTWQSNNVVGLAQAIYDDRAFDRLPILADALEDAGCTSPEILNHCRQPGEHVRGCWVVDLLLAKE